MGKKVTYILCFLLIFLFLSCDKDEFNECNEHEFVYLKLPDTTWFLTVQTKPLNVKLNSSTGLLQSMYSQTFSGLNEIFPENRVSADACRSYYTIPIGIRSYASIYSFELTCEVNHNPIKGVYQFEVKYQPGQLSKVSYDESIVLNLRDSLRNCKFELFSYSEGRPYRKDGFINLLPNFTNHSGKRFEEVYVINFQAPSIFPKELVLKNVWISKKEGLVQYEFSDGLIWSVAQ